VAAAQAGVDLMSCSFDSAEAQAHLPRLVAAAPDSFLSAATPHGSASPEEAIRIAFRALEIGASAVYCSASPFIIEAMARERIPVVGHLGMVPRHVTWTNYRAIGKTVEEARELYRRMKELESAGAYAADSRLFRTTSRAGCVRKRRCSSCRLAPGVDATHSFFFPTTSSATTKSDPRAMPKLTAISLKNTAACKRNALPPSANTSPT
jgi:hypothetical protein